MNILTINQIIKIFRTRKLPTSDGLKLSSETIRYMANKLRYPLIHAGGKIGYYDSILMAIMQHIREAVEYEKGVQSRKAQRAPKVPKTKSQVDDNYYMRNGERDNVDYSWEKNENVVKESNGQELTVLWLDDQRDPYKYLNTNRQSDTFIRNKQFYDNLSKQYRVNFVWVKNLYQFIGYIEKNGLPQFVSFDHDLNSRGGGEGLNDEQKMNNNGVNCAKWLVDYCKKTGQPLPKFYVHSANPKHGPEINRILTSENKKIIRLTENDLRRIVKESVKLLLKRNYGIIS